MIQVLPSILTNDPAEAKELLARCEDVAHSTNSGLINRVSVDIIDGKFADNKTIDPSVFDDVETTLKLDFQLMVVEPINWIERCIRAGADRIIGHIEQMADQTEFVGKVQEAGLAVGLGLDLPTPVDKLEQTILTDLDVVLLMSVPAGFGGQKFDFSVLDKIKKLDTIRARDATPFLIQDDGGVTFDSIDDVRVAGVDEVSVGRSIFAGDLAENIKKLTKVAYGRQ